MVSTRKKNYGEPPPPKKRTVPKATRKDEPKEHPIDKQVPCVKFVLFQRLPCELRLMIWEASMAPQLLVVRPRKVGPSRSPDSRKIIPAQLSVNVESRQSALRRYSLRFIMTLAVNGNGNPRGYCPHLDGKKFHAKVVMSPDDTLGLQDWEDLHLGPIYRFDVKNANLVNCFGMQQNIQTCGTQPEVKNVAYLAPDIGMIHDLNSSDSCDVNSLLHGKPSQLTEYCPQGPGGLWSVGRHKERFWIYSRNFNGTLQEWGRRLLHRVRHKGLFYWLAPHIMAFQLGKKPEKFTGPTNLNLVPTRTLDPEGFYLSCEWNWRQKHSCPKGF